MLSPARTLSLLVALVAALGGFARAHKLRVFATGEGKAIDGYVYFPGGGRARGLTVTALASDGSKLGEATTDKQGEFTVAVKFRCDHKLVAQTADGHKATFLLKAAELDGDLPPFGAASPTPATKQAPASKAPASSVAATPDAELEALVKKAVRNQVRPLREQIERYEEKTRLRDIIGGIGYILGLMGLAFYFLGSARRRARDADRPSS